MRGTRAISLIYQLTSRIPEFISNSHLERNEAWATYWSPIFRTLSTQCVNPCREVRHQALSHLQRCLLSPGLTPPSTTHSSKLEIEAESEEQHNTEWIAIFHEVLFPLLLRLLKPEIFSLDPLGMSETRTQAATLLCKVFLHYLVRLVEGDCMLEVWLKVLDVLDRLMNSGQSGARGGGSNSGGGAEGLEEQIPEILKNCLLVMEGAGYLKPPRSPPPAQGEKEEGVRVEGRIWDETSRRVERFLPGMFEQVFPEQVKQQQQQQQQEVEKVLDKRKGDSGDKKDAKREAKK
jgi:golgi-specific brefeldin A-resistance guanine nucleotide exchange factor 1